MLLQRAHKLISDAINHAIVPSPKYENATSIEYSSALTWRLQASALACADCRISETSKDHFLVEGYSL